MSSAYEVLANLQKELKAPKGQFNAFGKYKYRSCEDIVESVKKILGDKESLILSDDVVEVGGRVYIKATAKLHIGTAVISTSAFAREPEHKKGMDESQITGTASSYARKYALNGLFAIDDTKDLDSDEHHNQTTTKAVVKKNPVSELDPGSYVMPIGFDGVKGEKLADIDSDKLQKTYEYWSSKAQNGKAKEAVAALKLYLGKV